MQRGWTLISKGNFSEAAKRFNQAYLVAPEQSAIYHGFAIIAVARFNDRRLRRRTVQGRAEAAMRR